MLSKKDTSPKDSLILSIDYSPERIIETNDKIRYFFTYEQNEALCPKTLLYKNDKLYVIKNRKRQKKKIKNGYYREPFNSWYIRFNCTAK